MESVAVVNAQGHHQGADHIPKNAGEHHLEKGRVHEKDHIQVKDVRVPENLQRAMAAEAEAAREARAKVGPS